MDGGGRFGGGCSLGDARPEQPSPKPHQRALLRHCDGHRGWRCSRRFRDRDGKDGCGGCGQDAGHQRRLRLRLLVALPDIRIIDGRLVGQLVADGVVLWQFLLVVADAPQGIGGRLHVRVGHDHQGDLVAFFDLVEPVALFIHEVRRHVDRHLRDDASGALLARLLADQPQQRQ